MSLIDLHTHSTASDGVDCPAALVARAAERKLRAIALTDHDTVAGLAEAQGEADRIGVEFVPGIEISAALPGRPGELHVLGYFIDPMSNALGRMNEMLLAVRAERNEKLIARLAELKMPITMEELRSVAGSVITRAHFAELMLRHRYAHSVKEVFDKYLGQGGSAYFDKAMLTFRQAFDVIHGAGGLVAIAHPVHMQVESDVELEVLIGRFVDCGLDAIEAFHPDHSPAWVRKVQRLAKRFDLCITGGSDYHGMGRIARPLGGQHVAEMFLDQLKDRLASKE
ncbi:MAG: PHP domain-containing protein [Phycisphaerae bacterium]|nr:PHP domain-containing protein [Phycisphaerae bacterium]